MRRLIVLAGVIAASPALAQVSYPPSISSDEVQAAILAATPEICSTPMPDTLMGSPGSGPRCTPRSDATRPTIVQAKTTLSASDASYSVTFDRPFETVPLYADARVLGAAQPFLCTVVTITTTSVSGKCFQLVATTLPVATTALSGLVISPITNAGAGLSVRVFARQ